jgi:hypothetical protein
MFFGNEVLLNGTDLARCDESYANREYVSGLDFSRAANNRKMTSGFSPCANPSQRYELDDDPEVVFPELDEDEEVVVVEVAEELALLSPEFEAGLDSFDPPPESDLESDLDSDLESDFEPESDPDSESDEPLFEA